MIVMLNPQPLPPRAEPAIVTEAAPVKPEAVISKGTCPTCCSGIFRDFGDAVILWSVAE